MKASFSFSVYKSDLVAQHFLKNTIVFFKTRSIKTKN